MAPGSCGAVFTGQAVLFNPALTALTRAMLSFFVRPLIDGTVTGGSLAAESPAVPLAVLDAVTPAGTVAADDAPETGVELAVDVAGEARATCVPSGGTSPTGFGRASLLAAQAMEVEIARALSAVMDKYLSNRALSIGFPVTR
jgi:hypothetical protein